MASAKSKPKPAKPATKKSPARKPAAAAKGPRSVKGGVTKRPARTPSEVKFVSDVLARGEAAAPLPSGELPPGATHEICGPEEKFPKLPKIKRRRFSAF